MPDVDPSQRPAPDNPPSASKADQPPAMPEVDKPLDDAVPYRLRGLAPEARRSVELFDEGMVRLSDFVFGYLERVAIVTVLLFGARQLHSWLLYGAYFVAMAMLLVWLGQYVDKIDRWFVARQMRLNPKGVRGDVFWSIVFWASAVFASYGISRDLVRALADQTVTK